MGKLTRLVELVKKRKAAEAKLKAYAVKTAFEIAHIIKDKRQAEVNDTVYSVVGQGEKWGITARGHYAPNDKWLPCVLDNDAPDSVIYQFALDLHELIRCFEEQESGAYYCTETALSRICPQKEEA